jgi:biopolymer transport protein ExbD
MGRFKLKRKDVFIDMTAMSDVTVLLLTFFMLTSTFIKPEPVKVNTPGSVSEIKIPESNIVTILVESSGKVFLSMDKKGDLMSVLDQMQEKYGQSFTPEEKRSFGLLPAFGLPVGQLKGFLDLPSESQTAYLKSDQNPGIPCDSTRNEFKDWILCARDVNPDLRIAIKADAKAPYKVIKTVMNSLQDIKENRYNLITALKTED